MLYKGACCPHLAVLSKQKSALIQDCLAECWDEAVLSLDPVFLLQLFHLQFYCYHHLAHLHLDVQ